MVWLLHPLSVNNGATLTKGCHVPLLYIIEIHGTAHGVAVIGCNDAVHDLQVRIFERFRRKLVRDLVSNDKSLSVGTNFCQHVREELNRFTSRVSGFSTLLG